MSRTALPQPIKIGDSGPPPNANYVASNGKFKGHGSPEGVVSGYVGAEYIDLDTGDVWNKVSPDDYPPRETKNGWVLDEDSGAVLGASTGTTEERTTADRWAEARNVRDFGALTSGGTITAALAAWDWLVIDGVVTVSSNLTIASGKVLIFRPGGKLKPASGVKVSIYGQVQAGRHEIFDYSASGSCVFPLGGIGLAQRNDYIMAEWYGAVGDNGSTNNATAFGRICGGTSSENLLKVVLSASYYNFVTGFTPKSRMTFEGVPGRLTRLQFGPAADATFITISDSVFDIRFKNVQLNSTITSGTIRTKCIAAASAAHTANNINLEDVQITGFNAAGIEVGSWIDCRFTRVRFENISNLAAYGGTGAGPATCIKVLTGGFLNAAKITETDSSNCEQFTRGVFNSITFDDCDHDQTDSSLDAITGLESFMYFLGGKNIRVVRNYFEGIRATGGNAMVHAVDTDNIDVSFNYMTNLRGVTNVASIFIHFGSGCIGRNAGGNSFTGSPGTAFIQNNASGGFCTTFPENIYRDSAGTQFNTRASLLSRMSEATTDMLLADAMHWARPVHFWSITTSTGVTRPRKLARGLNGGTPAANDGVGDTVELENASNAYVEVAQSDVVWTDPIAVSATVKKVFRILVSNVLTNVFELISTGVKLMGGPTITVGTGTPESAVTAPTGSLFLRTNGGASTTLYVKESGAGNTGWVAK